MKFYLPFIFLTLIAISACKKENKMSKIPQITLLSVAPNTVKSGSSEDSISISFKIQDGDADLGNDPMSGKYDIFMIHSSDTTMSFSEFLPEIPEQIKDPAKGFEGVATVVIKAAFLVLDSLHQNGDTISFELYMKDRADNESNHITTPDIYIVP
jgi:hypothetical protein